MSIWKVHAISILCHIHFLTVPFGLFLRNEIIKFIWMLSSVQIFSTEKRLDEESSEYFSWLSASFGTLSWYKCQLEDHFFHCAVTFHEYDAWFDPKYQQVGLLRHANCILSPKIRRYKGMRFWEAWGDCLPWWQPVTWDNRANAHLTFEMFANVLIL